MASYVVRVWLPDRPGALGQVASRIGAVRGDVVGIDILEQGGGRAVDELVVVLPGEGLIELLAKEINEVEGVDVEDIRPLGASEPDHRLAALEAAVCITEAGDRAGVLDELVRLTVADMEGEWGCVVGLPGGNVMAAVGAPPEPGWVVAFVEGSRHSEALAGGRAGPQDLAWAELPGLEAALMVSRPGRPLRWRERRQLALIARVADATACRC